MIEITLSIADVVEMRREFAEPFPVFERIPYFVDFRE